VIVDATAPAVMKVGPAKNATRVSPGANVWVLFSEDMLASSIDGQTFKLYKKGSTNALRATVTYDARAKRAMLDPSANLRRGVTYKAVVTTGVKDLAGNQLVKNQVWYFTIRK
jgi:hypothetical protein